MNGQDNAPAREPAPPHDQVNVSVERIARVYAEALLDAADRQGAADQVRDELHEIVHGLFGSQPGVEEFFAGAAVGTNQKEAVLTKAFEGRVHPLLFNFLHVVNRHDRLSILRAIGREYVNLDNKRKRRLPVRVETAVPLTEEQRQRLYDELRTGFKLEPLLETVVDPDVLGGMIVRFSDWVFDASVRGEIENLGKQLLARSGHEIQSRRDRFSTD